MMTKFPGDPPSATGSALRAPALLTRAAEGLAWPIRAGIPAGLPAASRLTWPAGGDRDGS
jgi:hypothetical protein